jgi:hypothetical protein
VRRLAVAVVVLTLIAAGCGDDKSPAQQALADAEKGLGRVSSGDLTMQLLASPSGRSTQRGVGFRIEGPFRVAEHKGELPVADLEYTRITGAARSTSGFVSTGEEAFVEVDGVYRRLDDAQVDDLRVTDDAEGVGLEGLALEDWVEKPTARSGPRVDGVATRRITGGVDAVPAINDLLDLAGGFGAPGDDAPTRLEGQGADAVRRAVRSATMVLLVGAEDNLLRRLELVIDLSVRDPEVRTALQGLAGARLSLDLEVNRMNRPVTVKVPAGVRN